jgi:predicted HTH transcriptional regulator
VIFDFKSIDEIGDQELEDIVAFKVPERQFIEFKATFLNKDDSQRLELLRDVVAFANSGGGYIIIGINDNGKDCAGGFTKLDESTAENIKKSMHGSYIRKD